MFIELDWVFGSHLCLNTDCIIAVVPRTKETHTCIVMKDDIDYFVKNEYEDIIALLNPNKIYQKETE